MDNVNKTLYIPLYGKAYVSKRGLFVEDKKAEEIWNAEGFVLKGKSKSRWLAYYMGVRCAVFDEWVRKQVVNLQDAVVINVGCGLDSRVLRIGAVSSKWYDVDFADVIEERKRYYSESANYKMIAGDLREGDWLTNIPENKCAIVVVEGVSMYLTFKEIRALMANLCACFDRIAFLMDCYTVLAARISKYKNPIKDIGVDKIYGIDNPASLQFDDFVYIREHAMIPQKYIEELSGVDKYIFTRLYAGCFSKKLYRLFEYEKM